MTYKPTTAERNNLARIEAIADRWAEMNVAYGGLTAADLRALTTALRKVWETQGVRDG